MCKVKDCYGFVKVSLISGKASVCYGFVKISLNPGKASLRRLTRRADQPELVRSSVPVPAPTRANGSWNESCVAAGSCITAGSGGPKLC